MSILNKTIEKYSKIFKNDGEYDYEYDENSDGEYEYGENSDGEYEYEYGGNSDDESSMSTNPYSYLYPTLHENTTFVQLHGACYF